jgi:glycine dehydrogenase
LPHARSFVPRHNSTTPVELDAMVATTGFGSLDELIKATVPASIV